MKAIVLYYSATGNTAMIAKSIHKGMCDEFEVCDIKSIRKANPADMVEYDLIVVGSPIWYYRETANLTDFIYKMPEMSGKLCVMFCTHGSYPAGYMFVLSTIIKHKGMTIIGWSNWYGGVSQVLHMPKPYLTDGNPDEISLRQAEEFGREMGSRAKRVAQGEKNLIPKSGTGEGPGARDLWKVNPMVAAPHEEQAEGQSLSERAQAMRKFNKKKCKYPECGKCIDVCPVKAISFSDGNLSVKGSCINCTLCDKLCPEEAIELNEDASMRRTQRVINMDKCTYPGCTLCADYCTMQCIDFSQRPPKINKSCEGDDLCWVICPNDAIEITNLDTTHAAMAPTCREDFDDHPFVKALEIEERKGNFRRYYQIDELGFDNVLYKNPTAPRFVITHE